MFKGLAYNRQWRDWRWSALGLVLFVTAQLGLVVHELDADAHAHGESCTICLVAHAKGGPAPSTVAFHKPDTRFEAPQVVAWRVAPAPLQLAYASRAPPRHTSA